MSHNQLVTFLIFLTNWVYFIKRIEILIIQKKIVPIIEQISLFDDQKENTEDISIPCKIKNWKTKKIMTFKECKEIR